MDYVMAGTVDVDERHRPKESGAINGGLFQRPKEAPNTTIYVGVSSIAATLKKVADAGGRVVTPKTASASNNSCSVSLRLCARAVIVTNG